MTRDVQMQHRLIFLDFDGVVCTPRCLTSGMWWFDPEAIGHLNDLLAMAPSQIVITSSWRRGRSVRTLQRLLRLAGFRYSSMVTAALPTQTSHLTRGQAIQDWMMENGGQWRRFAILDDDSDMRPYMHKLVLTRWMTGLTAADAVRAARLLGIRIKAKKG